MDVSDLKNKLVAVLGYGIEGKVVSNHLIKHGIKPVLFDQKPWSGWSKDEQEAIIALGVNFIFGPDWQQEFKGFDVAFRSPGIALSTLHPTPSTLITSQTKWFFEHCPAKIIGVTGTKGKGTTCALICEMLKEDIRYKILDNRGSKSTNISNLIPNIYLTGNIGKVQPLDILDDLRPRDWVVYELSSFQLQDLTQSPHIAVVLMVTSEHLDYHKDAVEYIEAKMSITKYQKADDIAIYNVDYPSSVNIGKLGKGKKIKISRKRILKAGCFVKNDRIVIAGSDFRLPTSDLQLRGFHNLENVCAAVAAAKAAGIDGNAIKQAAVNFKGLEHRLEFVAEKKGIKFYNDSFSTTPETAIAAVKSFREPEILILGGSQKRSDFAELGKVISDSKNIKSLILIGNEAKRIKQTIDQGGGTLAKILTGADTMPKIFDQIKSVAQTGDVVLLSPACASFDMFNSYVDRGNQFKKAVRNF